MAWKEFKRGKIGKPDVARFYFSLEDNLFALHDELAKRTYRLLPYKFFYVRDPKLRPIHKASVRDRVLLQAVFRILYQVFDKKFIFDSYSCRYKKGVHTGVGRLRRFVVKMSANYRHTAYALKCDVKKFFGNIDHAILMDLLKQEIDDENVLWLLEKIIGSFGADAGRGLPLGNVTSQLFANVYLNELDQFVKHSLKEKYYLRYCDDFIILSRDTKHLAGIIPLVNNFLSERLRLTLHPQKVQICKLRRGIDFLGFVILPYHTVLRTKTKRRMLTRLKDKSFEEKSLQSYLGLIKWCDGRKLKKRLLDSCN